MFFPLKKRSFKDLVFQLEKFPQSSFSFERKFDIHTGIDIYCEKGDSVFAMESGVVVSMDIFTGAETGSPWWNTTYSLVIKGDSGYILYGEIEFSTTFSLGEKIREGQEIGRVVPVLKKDKGLNPINMLHLELYSNPPFSLIWNKNSIKPENLKNPLDILRKTE